MDIQKLENQAWALLCRLNSQIEIFGARDKRTFRAYRAAAARHERRQNKMFSLSIDGKYYECDCSECHIEDCSSCGNISNQPGGFALSSAQPSGVLGQGKPICYQCEEPSDYLFDDSRCKNCTRLTREEIEGSPSTLFF